MSNWFEGDLEANGIKIHYHRTGAPGKPALLLLHGVTDSGRVWERVARTLADEYDIVMPDTRGHGQSTNLASGFSLPLLADDAAGVIGHLDLPTPYVWGHSMGALTAAILAAHYPPLVRAAVLEDPPLMTLEARRRLVPQAETADPPQQLAAVAERADPAPLFPDFRAMSDAERLTTARTMNPRWHPDELPPWAESKAQVDPAVYQHFWSIPDYPWEQALERIVCPTLLLTGDPDAGALVTPEVAHTALALLPQGQLVQMAGSGHNIHREAYEQTVQAVRAFLQAH
jgi:pimeloyl-ACP methyl ester carboxylesterase